MTEYTDYPLWHDAFYRFVPIDDPDALCEQLETLCREQALLGSILIASEGINGMLAGSAEALDALRRSLGKDPRFATMLYKRSPCQTMPFERLKVKHKREIVALGVPQVDACARSGVLLEPSAWQQLLGNPEVILIDNRNSFEVQLGRFRGAIDPGVDNFRDFASYAQDQLEHWRGKPVAMYCTGGIRCEKASSWLMDLGLEVYQLEGGILNYFASIPNAERDFEGHCFVFDQRRLLDSHLQPVPEAQQLVDALEPE